jgi:LmbE family N-acetylglucosaminyl deacetylase
MSDARPAAFPTPEGSAAVARALRTRFLLGRLEQRFGPAARQQPRPWLSEGFARVLVIASHADDEVIGCGGLLRHCVEAGSEVQVLIVTESPDGSGGADQRRIAESRRAQQVLGYSRIEDLHLPEKGLLPRGPSFEALRRELSLRIGQAAPDLLLIPNPVDFHHDHATVALACLSVPRPATLIYEIWGPCRADVVLPLSPALAETKRRALDCYQTQLAQVDYQAVMDFIQGFRAGQVDDRRVPAAECYQWVLGTGA